MAIGIICEYNPFHNGHAFQLTTARKVRALEAHLSAAKSADTSVVCVMSPHFVQRGEPAILDKWTRTRMALSGGADILLELPTLYATASAEKFAYGAVATLSASGLVDSLSFGMEEVTDFQLLQDAAEILAGKSFDSELMDEVSLSFTKDEYQDLLEAGLAEGLTYAAARSAALSKILDEDLPTGPNSILVLEYMKACLQLDFLPLMLPVQRTTEHSSISKLHDLLFGDSAGGSAADSDYNSPRKKTSNSKSKASKSKTSETAHLSAGEIRSLLLNGESADNLLPPEVAEILKESSGGSCLLNPENCFLPLLYRLAEHTPSSLAQIDEVIEGLENRVLAQAASAHSMEELVEGLKTKRYPTSRLRRILLNTLLDITKEKKEALGFEAGPPYIRVLGVKESRKDLLSDLTSKATLPVITNPARQVASLDERGQAFWAEEVRFSAIYRSLCGNQVAFPAAEESCPMIIM